MKVKSSLENGDMLFGSDGFVTGNLLSYLLRSQKKAMWKLLK